LGQSALVRGPYPRHDRRACPYPDEGLSASGSPLDLNGALVWDQTSVRAQQRRHRVRQLASRGAVGKELRSASRIIRRMLRLSAIVPATDQPQTLNRCLAAIKSATEAPEELIVVAEPRGIGPAAARNAGVRRASGDVLVFVDSDVAVHPNAFELIRAAFSGGPDLTAVFGSYDDDPEAGGIVSDFRNLLHHHVHQSSAGVATTFWAGLGAVRREAFLTAGGFDDRSFPQPSIEDIELGMRLLDRDGRIVLDPLLQGKHLKRWTLNGMVRTDFAARGAPWVDLLLTRGSGSTALNLGWRHRMTAAASLALLAAVSRRRPSLSVALLASIFLLNHSFYRMLLRRRGPALAAAALPLHVVHHLVGLAAVPEGFRRYLRRRSA
jgi:Glycosyl transferase family 2